MATSSHVIDVWTEDYFSAVILIIQRRKLIKLDLENGVSSV